MLEIKKYFLELLVYFLVGIQTGNKKEIKTCYTIPPIVYEKTGDYQPICKSRILLRQIIDRFLNKKNFPDD